MYGNKCMSSRKFKFGSMNSKLVKQTLMLSNFLEHLIQLQWMQYLQKYPISLLKMVDLPFHLTNSKVSRYLMKDSISNFKETPWPPNG